MADEPLALDSQVSDQRKEGRRLKVEAPSCSASHQPLLCESIHMRSFFAQKAHLNEQVLSQKRKATTQKPSLSHCIIYRRIVIQTGISKGK